MGLKEPRFYYPSSTYPTYCLPFLTSAFPFPIIGAMMAYLFRPPDSARLLKAMARPRFTHTPLLLSQPPSRPSSFPYRLRVYRSSQSNALRS